ncbi:PHP domain-like protein [Apiospora arundinis]
MDPRQTESASALKPEDEEEYSRFFAYFTGPRDLEHHSRWPYFFRMYGSVIPLMILPLMLVGTWATVITAICSYVRNISINPVLLTVLGFVVGLSLSFRSSTAYERYNEGRKLWAQLHSVTSSLARLVWVHANEREGHEQEDLLGKVAFCNMLVAFSVALKHQLRFEPFTCYDDMHPLLRHVPLTAHEAPVREPENPSSWTVMGWVLGLTMAEPNPREFVKSPARPLGNVPLELLAHCSAYIKHVIENDTFVRVPYQTSALNTIALLHDIHTNTNRIVNTPLPLAYSIAISQITWGYILLLPFQLFNLLGWATIPACIFAAYIILGIALIGQEIENPFEDGVNDLPLDTFCNQIRRDVHLITSRPASDADIFLHRDDHAPLWPSHGGGYHDVKTESVESIRELLARRVVP